MIISGSWLMAGLHQASRVSHQLAVLLPSLAGFFDFPERPDETGPEAD